MKIAFVTPWYGANIPGGAEAEARRTAERMARRGLPVEVLTTCVRDFYADWSENHHHPGLEVVNGVPVRRFPVRPRDTAAFDAVNARLMAGETISSAAEMVFMREMVRSPELEAHIRDHCQEYLYLFIPYMFGTTYWGIQICPDRSYLIPCLHDESYARMRLLVDPFRRVRGLICQSQPEMELAQRIYDLSTDQLILMGTGVDTEIEPDGDRFCSKYGVEEPFILYAGRTDAGKNIPLLIQYFHRFHRFGRPDLQLVFIGGGELPPTFRPGDGIQSLGFLPVQDKWDAYAAASVLCQPSTHESFSLVMMEAWVARTPALVHAHCTVTTDFCQQSNGGLWFANYAEFALALELLLDRPRLAAALGRNGRDYVLANFAWDHILDRYADLLGFA
jgi:glycosyltransferase involved in cell wall biosynthesis